jgi:hypothetical protein
MTWPVRVGTLPQCPYCGGCCYAITQRWDGSLYVMRHGDWSRCRGPSSDEMIDLLLDQFGLWVVAVGAR